jgi:hypothetical protein
MIVGEERADVQACRQTSGPILRQSIKLVSSPVSCCSSRSFSDGFEVCDQIMVTAIRKKTSPPMYGLPRKISSIVSAVERVNNVLKMK